MVQVGWVSEVRRRSVDTQTQASYAAIAYTKCTIRRRIGFHKVGVQSSSCKCQPDGRPEGLRLEVACTAMANTRHRRSMDTATLHTGLLRCSRHQAIQDMYHLKVQQGKHDITPASLALSAAAAATASTAWENKQPCCATQASESKGSHCNQINNYTQNRFGTCNSVKAHPRRRGSRCAHHHNNKKPYRCI
jgi:hypothetical protein